jgi:hypothetical protein
MRGEWRLIAAVAAVPFLLLAGYDVASFQSRRAAIDAVVAQASATERNPSPALRRLWLTAIGDLLPDRVAGILMDRLDVPPTSGESMRRKGARLLWSRFVGFHLSVDEQLAVYESNVMITPGVRGFEAGARAMFELPLDQLDEEQLATLVVLTRWPSRLSRPESHAELIGARDSLLRRAHMPR